MYTHLTVHTCGGLCSQAFSYKCVCTHVHGNRSVHRLVALCMNVQTRVHVCWCTSLSEYVDTQGTAASEAHMQKSEEQVVAGNHHPLADFTVARTLMLCSKYNNISLTKLIIQQKNGKAWVHMHVYQGTRTQTCACYVGVPTWSGWAQVDTDICPHTTT